MVTEHDRAAERLIVGGAARRPAPTTRIIGEEGTATPARAACSWLIDPIDGTTNFLYGLPGYSVSIAAADGDGHAGRRGVRAGHRRAVHRRRAAAGRG